MGKRTSKKHGWHHAWKLKQSKRTAIANQGTSPSQETKAMPNNDDRPKQKHVWRIIFPVIFWCASNYWGVPMLTNLSFTWGYVLFLLVNGAVLGWAIWVSVDWVCRKLRLAKFTKQVKIGSIFVAIFIFVFISPSFIGYFIKAQGSIEMPTFLDASTPIFVHYGTRANDYFYTNTTIGELKQQGGQVPLKINGQNIFIIHIEDNKLYIDTLLFAGIKDEDQHIFAPPVAVQNNSIINKPADWKLYQNNMNLEIDNEDGIPVLIMQYHSPYSITISGLFATTFGILKVDNDPNAIYRFGDTLAELGIYKVNRVFIHSFFDLFRSERTYILE